MADGGRMRRRDVITLLGGAVTVWPIGSSAPAPALPVIGVLSVLSPGSTPRRLPAFHQGLADGGYVEGRNVGIEYYRAKGEYERLPALVADMVRAGVAVIAATGSTAAALAAKAATSTIPIVFTTGDDPVEIGLVASLSRPGGNATGVSMYTTGLVEKRVELLRELVPGVA